MKKALSAILILCMAFSILTVSSFAETLKGDLDENGKIQLNDAMRTFQAVAGKIKLSETEITAADVTNDSKIQLNDAMMIFQYVAGKIDSFDKPIVMLDNISVCVGPAPQSLDPMMASSNEDLTYVMHLYEGLYSLNENATVSPAQAESVEISSDGCTYTFHLKDNLKWNDGSALSAYDFVYGWNRAYNSDAPYTYLFANIKGYNEGTLNISAPDAKTFVVQLYYPDISFLQLTTYPIFAPVKDTIQDFSNGGIGNGAFKIKLIDDNMIVIEKNNYYQDLNNVHINEISFILSSDIEQADSLYQEGTLLYNKISSYDNSCKLSSMPGIYYLNLNCSKPYLSDAKVRKALSISINRTELLNNLSLYNSPAKYILPDITAKDQPVYVNENQSDLAQAKELLSQAGYPNGDGIPTLEYVVNDSSGHIQSAEYIKSCWQKLGINMEIKTYEWNEYLNKLSNKEFDVCRNGWISETTNPLDILELFYSTSEYTNESNWANNDYNTLLERVSTETNETTRNELLKQASEIFINENPAVILYHYNQICRQKSNLYNVETLFTGQVSFVNAYAEK